MCDTIIHRGPDDGGVFLSEDQLLGLGHRRLSIIDLTTGQQPMSNPEGTIWIVFNGEIYNYPELKKELLQKGCQFRTTSDTEVIIQLYQVYGESAFHRLNGIFAFAIYDSTKNCLVLARDHFGVKPLYYSFLKGNLVFGSEIKTILAHPDSERNLDHTSLHSFLSFRYNPSPQTLFSGIRKLHAGHYLKISSDQAPVIQSFWNYQPETNLHITETDAVEKYQQLLEQSVKRQMISDVPVGLLLSGGVDSAVIGQLMNQFSSRKIKTFTVGFVGKGDYNELDDARISSEFLKSEHHEIQITQKEYLDFFFQSFYYTEEPIAEMTIPALYYVSKLASQSLKVVLSGQGADEPLAGYKRYRGEKLISRYAALLKTLPTRQISKAFPRNERLRRAAFASGFANELDRFIAIYTIFTPTQIAGLLKKDVLAKCVNEDKKIVERLYSLTPKLHDSLSKILFIDTRMTLSDNLLVFGDKMTMANSLECRVPFLDTELVVFLESLPSGMKLKGSTHKYIHKTAVKKWLPDSIIYRKKRGFATPMDQWLQGEFSEKAKEIFNDRDSACREYFNLDFINQMLLKHRQKKENYQRNIFALLSFEIWYRSFFKASY